MIKRVTIRGHKPLIVETETVFALMNARVAGESLVVIEAERSEISVSTVHRVLVRLRRAGKIDFFVFNDEFAKKEIEVAYLFNKFPELETEDRTGKLVYVKM